MDAMGSQSKFHGYTNNTSDLGEAIRDFTKLFEHECHDILDILRRAPFVIDIKDTEFIAFTQINANGDFQFELMSKTNQSIQKEPSQNHTFVNVDKFEDDYDSLIRRVNSNFEVVVYGQRIPIKTRPDISLEELDIGFRITPIHDPKQSETSL